jgi:hypothetical protein
MSASDRPADPGILELRADNTHLYRGARLLGPADAAMTTSGPGAVRILFRDGGEATAELLVEERSGGLVIAVAAHRTAAGRDIPAKLWRLADVTESDDGTVVVVGAREEAFEAPGDPAV